MIFAGAGSGKTRTLTYRFAYLIQEANVHPTEILAVTFTNKAAREMRERIVKITGIQPWKLTVSTFHAFCLKLLRDFGEAMGLDPTFTILDASDQNRLLRTIFKDLDINTRLVSIRHAMWQIEHAKAHGITAQAFTPGPFDLIGKRVAEIYDTYEKRLKALNAMDFSDLLLNTYRLLNHSPETLAHFRRLYRHIMVDEYQDTNFIQYQIVRLLALEHRNLCVVGDDDQSIYSWRGANKENIRLFRQDFPEAKVILLEQNYRSTKTILRCASHLIRHNEARTEKTLWTENAEGDPVSLYEAEDEDDEARWVIATIQALREEGHPWHDFAVFYRTNAQSRVLEERLIHRGIPYQIFGGFRFYDRKEIKDILAYLRLLLNPWDVFSLRRAIGTPPRGIGKSTLDKVEAYAHERGLPILEALGRICEEPGFRMKSKARPFYEWIISLRSDIETGRPSTLIERVVTESGYLTPYRGSSDPHEQAIIENVEELITATESYEQEAEAPSLADFMDHVSLMTDTDTLDETAGRVTLMTLHSAKGLEFPVVFITGLEEGLFPHDRSLQDESKVDEERRLFYVGITRSRQRLFLSFCNERSQYGHAAFRRPSRFLSELPRNQIHVVGKNTSRFRPRVSSRPSPHVQAANPTSSAREEIDNDAGDNGDFRVGQEVIHPTFGKGIIRVKEVKDQNAKLLIHFEGLGLKLIYPKFVELVRL